MPHHARAMAVIDEVLAPRVEAPVGERPRARLRLVAGFVAGLLLVLGLAGAALLAYDTSYDGRVLSGVRAGGADLSGMDRAQAMAAIEAAYAGLGEGRLVLRTVAGDVEIPYSRFSRAVDAGAMADEAMAAGRSGGVLERALGEPRLALDGRSIEPRLVMDEQELRVAVASALARLAITPVDATIRMGEGGGFVTTPARMGRTFDADAAAAAALAAVGRVDAPAKVDVQAAAVRVTPTISDDDVIAARLAAQRMMRNVVVTFGGKKWTIKSATVGRWLGFQVTADGSVIPVIDGTRIPAALSKVAKGVEKAPLSATYLKTSRGRIVGVAPSKDGRRLDLGATSAAIGTALHLRATGADAAPVAAATVRVAPRLTTAEAVAKGPLMTRLGSWKTWFPISNRNYFGANIWLPAKFIDGTVLYPGQTFEWWRAIGPVTTSRGFGLGGFIAGDHTEPTGAMGGGMCSSSTTLFNAALRAGLRMGARANHRYYINRYPLGLDATVSGGLGGGQTMTFTNDMKTPIVIRSYRYVSKGLGWVRYEIWGIPDGRTVSLTKPVVSNFQKATTYKVYVSSLPHGVRQQTEYPSNGMDVSVTRTVRDNHGRVIHRETYRSHYTLWNGLIQIGA
jgi:vancomycin resistance protein YoaR